MKTDSLKLPLSTMELDGSRRWLRPRLSMGQWWRKRQSIAYLLMVVFVAIPHVRLNGRPLILLDIVAREFTILGKTFYPTDTLVLALFMLCIVVGVVLVTAIAGRAWCGWACPQTVYMEFLFRPIDRLFDQTQGKGGKPRNKRPPLFSIVRFGVYLILCMFVAHTFLSYFVGTDRLAIWIRQSPLQHPTAFLVMAGTTALMMFDFMFFREQLCLIACPYGRLQSVMLDRHSLIVAYDYVRGEPRKKGKRSEGSSAGSCVDCNQCVVVCPTGIDIRNGLQMECINCTQCIDACDSVMDRVRQPKGLIRYSSQDAIARERHRLWRPRTMVYPLILIATLTGLAFSVAGKSGFDARIIRGRGAPFSMRPGGMVSNSFSLQLVNRTDIPQLYRLSILAPELVSVEVMDEDALSLNPGETKLVPIVARFPSHLTFRDGKEPTTLEIIDQSDNQRVVDFRILGPR